jgi:hypothetical protein
MHHNIPSRPKPQTSNYPPLRQCTTMFRRDLNPKPQTVDSVVMFVMDLTGGSGEKSSIKAQLDVRDELKQRFPDHLWIDVLSKGDLPRCVFLKYCCIALQMALSGSCLFQAIPPQLCFWTTDHQQLHKWRRYRLFFGFLGDTNGLVWASLFERR